MRGQYYLGLVGGAAVIVPDGELLHVRGFLVQRLGLAPESLASPVNPDVERLHPAPIINKFSANQPITAQYCNNNQSVISIVTFNNLEISKIVMFDQSDIRISTINQLEISIWFSKNPPIRTHKSSYNTLLHV